MNDLLFFILEIVGTVAFAISGVMVALEKELDVFGAVVLGLVTSVGGGMMRDLILGITPPVAFRVPVYSITAVCVSLMVYVIIYANRQKVDKEIKAWSSAIGAFDSIGLGVFTVGGINAAHTAGFTTSAYLCIFVSLLTACGGGVLRDILAGRIPVILKKRVYALASLFGAAVYQLLTEYNIIPVYISVIISASLVILIRILATVFKWNLPRIRRYENRAVKSKTGDVNDED